MKPIGFPSIVIAGLWNRQILTPDWFYSQFSSDFPKKEKVPVEVELSSGLLKFDIEDIEIQPQNERLMLFAKKREARTYELMENLAQGIASKLRHTPFIGIGYNFDYSLESKDSPKLFSEDMLNTAEKFYKANGGAIVLDQFESVHQIQYQNCRLNLKYKISKQERSILFNYHYPTTDHEKIIEYGGNFRGNMERSESLALSLVE